LLRGAVFINRLGFDVGRGPVVQLLSVEPNAALPDGKLVDVRADFGIKNRSAHAQIRGRLLGPDEARK